ncbi:glycosyltransferase family 2 protein [Bacillus sp. 1NLA3E]|uniref:glycosyltransferase family 2 protein n=1 Tax=Bacillus sp. 1NLA3E TaxID=666686 RepID=UPI000247EC3A|nr:glycosyltransferase [Bacillus sp. 1NLA3E]AGK55737.1 glycosyl transferase family protein [Bacillus sp. 1NLA3E]
MNPKISIIVPVFNVERFIHDCVDSILGQTFKDFELILVNDGSIDRSGDICDEYSKKDDRIIVIHKENGGQSSARNRGIDLAKGDYIGFIDSDDWIDKDMYEVLYKKAIETDTDISACNIIEYQKDSTKRLFCNDSTYQIYDRNSAMNEIFLNQRLTYSPCNKIYKKDLFNCLRFKEGYILEDMDFAYKIIHQSNKIFYTGQAMYNYRYNDKSTLRKTFSKKRLDEYSVRKEMYAFYLENYPAQADEVYAEWFLKGLELYINIEKYYRNEKKQYKYLIDVDRRILKSLVGKKSYNKKKKILLSIGLISINLLVTVYRLYWDKIKKEL